MEFACDRCRKQFSTSYEPVTGRVYRIPCKCGNTIVLRFDRPQTEPPPIPTRATVRLTPPPLPPYVGGIANGGGARPGSSMEAGERAPAPAASPLATPSPAQAPSHDGAPLARLDPTASPEVSGEHPYEPSMSVPFGVAFAHSRRRAFFAGCGAGASAATVLVGAVALVGWLSGPRSENGATAAPMVNIGSKEWASPPPAVATATLGAGPAAREAPPRVAQAPAPVVAPPVLVEDAAEPQPVAEADDSEAQHEPAERQLVAEADETEAPAEAEAQTRAEHGPAPAEDAAAATEAATATETPTATETTAPADQSSDEPHQIALGPAVEPEQSPASDDAPGAPANEESGR